MFTCSRGPYGCPRGWCLAPVGRCANLDEKILLDQLGCNRIYGGIFSDVRPRNEYFQCALITYIARERSISLVIADLSRAM